MQVNYLMHHGIKGQKWGERNYQYEDGSLTPEGRERYGVGDGKKKKEKGAVSRFLTERQTSAGRNLGQGLARIGINHVAAGAVSAGIFAAGTMMGQPIAGAIAGGTIALGASITNTVFGIKAVVRAIKSANDANDRDKANQ